VFGSISYSDPFPSGSENVSENLSVLALLHNGLKIARSGDHPDPKISALIRIPPLGTACPTGGKALPAAPDQVYIPLMIAVKAENGRLPVTIPIEGMTPEEVNEFVAWLRVESVVRHSRLAPDGAWTLSEDIKSGWWTSNERRFTPALKAKGFDRFFE
jgi:hypothetical protein